MSLSPLGLSLSPGLSSLPIAFISNKLHTQALSAWRICLLQSSPATPFNNTQNLGELESLVPIGGTVREVFRGVTLLEDVPGDGI